MYVICDSLKMWVALEAFDDNCPRSTRTVIVANSVPSLDPGPIPASILLPATADDSRNHLLGMA